MKDLGKKSVSRHQIGEDAGGQRIDNYLVKLLKGVPKSHVYRILRSGEVRVNGGRAKPDYRVASGDELRIPPVRVAERPIRAAPPVSEELERAVLFEDEHLIALNKPSGLAVHGGSGVSHGVIEQLRRARPQARYLELVHRLDKQTSGVLLLAKKRSALTALQDQFRARATDKTYAALVIGAWPANKKVIDVPLHKVQGADGQRRVHAVDPDDDVGRRSITLVKVARRLAAYTLLDVTIKTGRTHQIRVHLAHEGHGIVGDDQYGDFALNRQLARGEGLAGVRFARMFLHAKRLAFDHPASGERIHLESPLPAECVRLLGVLCEPH